MARSKNAATFSLDDDNETGSSAVPVARVPILARLDSAKRGAPKTFSAIAPYDPDRDRALLAAKGPENTDALRLFLSIGNGRGSTKIEFSPQDLGVIAEALAECEDWIKQRPGEHPLASIVRRTFTAVAAEDGKIDCSFKVSERPMARSVDLTADEIAGAARWFRGFETALRVKLGKMRAEAHVEIPSAEDPAEDSPAAEGPAETPEPVNEGSTGETETGETETGEDPAEGSDGDLGDEIDPDTL